MTNDEGKRKTRFPHYHMCGNCAIKMGGKPTGDVCTVIQGICQYCNSPAEQFLIPWVDFDWKDDKETDRIAKASRD